MQLAKARRFDGALVELRVFKLQRFIVQALFLLIERRSLNMSLISMLFPLSLRLEPFLWILYGQILVG